MREIKLSKGYVALVDNEDYDYVRQVDWHYSAGYAAAYALNDRFRKAFGHLCIATSVGKMHNILLSPPAGFTVDHWNRNSLDNRVGNLRFCTSVQNMQNRVWVSGSSNYKGVHWKKSKSKWCTQLVVSGVETHLGLFASEEEAALVYDRAAYAEQGKFAVLNFPHNLQYLTPYIRVRPVTAKSGLFGVTSRKGRFLSNVLLSDGTLKHLGTFGTPEEAARYRDSYIIENNLKATRNYV